MGNADLLMNLPILMASNIQFFGKVYAGGFKSARKASNIIGKAGEATTRMSTKRGVARSTPFKPLAEGTEEISQKAASVISGDYYQDKFENFYRGKLNPEAEQNTVSWIKSFGSRN